MPFSNNPEQILRAQQGDNIEIGAIYEQYHLSIFRYLYYRVGDLYTAEDLASEVFVHMIRSLNQFRPNSVSFQAWLYQIARNLAIDHYRKSKVRNHTELEENLSSGEEALDSTIEKKLNNERLRRALNKLSNDQREVIELRFIAGMPISEVAQILHKSENAIKAHQRRGLAALRQILSEMEIPYA